MAGRRGFACLALLLDVVTRRIVGWRALGSMRSDLVLDAEEQAVYDRETDDGVVHHGDRGVPYLSRRYTERLGEAGLDAPVGSHGDSYDSALAEAVIGLFAMETSGRAGRRGLVDVAVATLGWVAWCNASRRLAPFGDLSRPRIERRISSSSRREDWLERSTSRAT